MERITGLFEKSAPEYPKKEISFHGISAKLMDEVKEMKQAAVDTKKAIDDISQRIKQQKTRSRQYLINEFINCINKLGDKEKNAKIRNLNNIYFEEIGFSIKKIKNDLLTLGYEITNIDDNIDDEFITVLKKFQKNHNLSDDGIFGYFTYDAILNELSDII